MYWGATQINAKSLNICLIFIFNPDAFTPQQTKPPLITHILALPQPKLLKKQMEKINEHVC